MLFLLLIKNVLSSISVYSPAVLKDRLSSGIPCSLGNFGNPPYDTSIVGMLWYPDKDRTGCKQISEKPKADFQYDNLIVMLDRGDCAYVLKVKHAQDIGARAVIIVDNRDNEDVEKIIMRDNGLGGNLFIPAFMINKEQGRIIKDQLILTEVSLVLNFEMMTMLDLVYLNFFISSGNKNSLSFLQEFSNIGKQLTKDNSDFTPHFAVIQCLTCEENKFSTAHVDCLGGGRYCAPDPDNLGPITGRMVVQENLRQLCMFDQISSDDTIKGYSQFFEFQEIFAKDCGLKKYTKECSENAMKSVGIDIKELQSCYEKSFERGYEDVLAVNDKLGYEIDYWLNNGLHFYPAVMINGQIYRGDLENSAVLVGICAGYAEWAQPKFCKKQGDETMEGYSTKSVVIALGIFFSILVVVLLVYRHLAKKELQKEMKMQVNSAVSQYFALSDSSTFKKSERQTVKSSYV